MVFLHPLGGAQDLTVSFLVDTDRDQDRNVLDLAAPASFQVYTIDMKHGNIKLQQKAVRLNASFTLKSTSSGYLVWLRAQ